MNRLIVEIANNSNHDVFLEGSESISLKKGEKRKFTKPIEVTNISELRKDNVRIKEVLNESNN